MELLPEREPVRSIHEGVMKVGVNQKPIFQYSIPKVTINGKLSVPSLANKGLLLLHLFVYLLVIKLDEKETFEVSGNGWYSHEFGGNEEQCYHLTDDRYSFNLLNVTYSYYK